MFTYKVISDFRHTYFKEGKKYLALPNEIIKSISPLNYVFLELIDNDIEATEPSKPEYQGNRQQATAIASSSSEIQALSQRLDAFMNHTEHNLKSLTSKIIDIEKDLSTNNQTDLKFKEDTNRRLSILKDAIRSMEEDVFGDAGITPATTK
jgi:hypothetical protein